MRRATIVVGICHVLLFVSAVGARAEHGEPGPRTITVSGQGVVHTEPDRVRISLRVETRAKSAREASQQNAARSDAMIKALKAALGEAGTVTTRGYDLTAEYEYDKSASPASRQRTPIGYLAAHSVTVVTRDLAALGGVIDTAVAKGATGADSIEFYREGLGRARRQALLAAGKAARADAEAVAESLGVSLGELLSAGSMGGQPIVPRYARGMMMEQAASTPIEPGSIDVVVTVNAVFAVH